jgi:hypothetical protein
MFVFGERRLAACRNILQWSEIPARTVKVSSIVDGEYAENVIRKNFYSQRNVRNWTGHWAGGSRTPINGAKSGVDLECGLESAGNGSSGSEQPLGRESLHSSWLPEACEESTFMSGKTCRNDILPNFSPIISWFSCVQYPV